MRAGAHSAATKREATLLKADPTNNNKTTELEQARRALISLIKSLQRRDRYAALLSRAVTTKAQNLVRSVVSSFMYWQRNTGKRVRKYGDKTGKTYTDAIERFIGDLLRAKGDDRSSGRIYHATGATTVSLVVESARLALDEHQQISAARTCRSRHDAGAVEERGTYPPKQSARCWKQRAPKLLRRPHQRP